MRARRAQQRRQYKHICEMAALPRIIALRACTHQHVVEELGDAAHARRHHGGGGDAGGRQAEQHLADGRPLRRSLGVQARVQQRLHQRGAGCLQGAEAGLADAGEARGGVARGAQLLWGEGKQGTGGIQAGTGRCVDVGPANAITKRRLLLPHRSCLV